MPGAASARGGTQPWAGGTAASVLASTASYQLVASQSRRLRHHEEEVAGDLRKLKGPVATVSDVLRAVARRPYAACDASFEALAATWRALCAHMESSLLGLKGAVVPNVLTAVMKQVRSDANLWGKRTILVPTLVLHSGYANAYGVKGSKPQVPAPRVGCAPLLNYCTLAVEAGVSKELAAACVKDVFHRVGLLLLAGRRVAVDFGFCKLVCAGKRYHASWSRQFLAMADRAAGRLNNKCISAASSVAGNSTYDSTIPSRSGETPFPAENLVDMPGARACRAQRRPHSASHDFEVLGTCAATPRQRCASAAGDNPEGMSHRRRSGCVASRGSGGPAPRGWRCASAASAPALGDDGGCNGSFADDRARLVHRSGSVASHVPAVAVHTPAEHRRASSGRQDERSDSNRACPEGLTQLDRSCSVTSQGPGGCSGAIRGGATPRGRCASVAAAPALGDERSCDGGFDEDGARQVHRSASVAAHVPAVAFHTASAPVEHRHTSAGRQDERSDSNRACPEGARQLHRSASAASHAPLAAFHTASAPAEHRRASTGKQDGRSDNIRAFPDGSTQHHRSSGGSAASHALGVPGYILKTASAPWEERHAAATGFFQGEEEYNTTIATTDPDWYAAGGASAGVEDSRTLAPHQKECGAMCTTLEASRGQHSVGGWTVQGATGRKHGSGLCYAQGGGCVCDAASCGTRATANRQRVKSTKKNSSGSLRFCTPSGADGKLLRPTPPADGAPAVRARRFAKLSKFFAPPPRVEDTFSKI
ncbi:hypothetical protein DIPPA_34183 [Diplonema papillatum]|nr:hypothetical protein DIPPA_34183 [Diplonema papillatum]